MKMFMDTIFKNKKPNFEKISKYGFTNNNGTYTYTTVIVEGQFQMTVFIAEDGSVDTKVIDTESGDEYVLHRMVEASGSFVGMVRTEHENVLLEIAKDCFDMDVFKSDYTQQIIEYVRNKYGDELEFLWKKVSDNAIWRRKDTNKWYAAVLVISKRKLGIDSDEIVEVIDLRGLPEDNAKLVDNDKYYPGYHMNKKHWITICLDESVSVEEICLRIDESYKLATK